MDILIFYWKNLKVEINWELRIKNGFGTILFYIYSGPIVKDKKNQI